MENKDKIIDLGKDPNQLYFELVNFFTCTEAKEATYTVMGCSTNRIKLIVGNFALKHRDLVHPETKLYFDGEKLHIEKP